MKKFLMILSLTWGVVGNVPLFAATALGPQDRPMTHASPKVYLVGAGIANLASAAYFIRDGKIPGKDITIFEQASVTGGSLDGGGSPEKGYSLRGGRMFTEEAYAATYDLLSFIPSLTDPSRTVKDEFFAFNTTFTSNSRARLVDKDRQILDASRLGVSLRDKLVLGQLILMPERMMGTNKIEDYFSPQFFKTNFWYLWATTFAFQPWHSAKEFKRYALRFIDEFPRLHNLGGVRRTAYNQYDAFVLPITKWLQGQGVRFIMNTKVTNLSFITSDNGEKSVERIHFSPSDAPWDQREILLQKNDLVVATIGSMVESSDCGSMTAAPKLKGKKDGGAWTFWENIAKGNPEFGRPSVFADRIDESKWESFTITLKDPTFFNLMEEFSGNKPGTGGLVTFKDSNWLMSIVLPAQPYFLNQPDDVQVLWGYGLFPDREGNFVKKKMSESTGEEILTELLHHLRFQEEASVIVPNSICIPCMMPFITSQFLTRSMGDRPAVVPKGSTNFAMVGQFSEIPDDTVFTVDYSVRAAQMAVYALLKLDKKVTPIHKGQYNPAVLFRALKTMLR